jgi:hypothetical protein
MKITIGKDIRNHAKETMIPALIELEGAIGKENEADMRVDLSINESTHKWGSVKDIDSEMVIDIKDEVVCDIITMMAKFCERVQPFASLIKTAMYTIKEFGRGMKDDGKNFAEKWADEYEYRYVHLDHNMFDSESYAIVGRVKGNSKWDVNPVYSKFTASEMISNLPSKMKMEIVKNCVKMILDNENATAVVATFNSVDDIIKHVEGRTTIDRK